MPIGATIGAAVVGAGASIYSSSQASHAQSRAAQTASNDELAVAQQNNALAAQIYNSNAARLDPYSALGLPAGGEYNALLGIAAPAAANPAAAPPPAAPISPNGSGVASGYAGPSISQVLGSHSQSGMNSYLDYYMAHPEQDPGFSMQTLYHDGLTDKDQAQQVLAAHQNYVASHPVSPTNAAVPATPTPTPTPASGPTSPTPSANNAMAGFETFYNSPTYQFPLQQGLHAVNVGYAAKGALESGAAMKAIDTFGANNAAGALSTYLDQLYRQEALGESASAALAGVGQNMVGQVSANNNNAASAAGNAALVAGQGSANMWNTVGAGIGQAAGTIAGAMGSSYHPSNALASSAYLGLPPINNGSNLIYGSGTGWS